jgi:hypothetical protein
MSDFTALFILFYVAHKIGDYWVQTDWQANNKATNWIALWSHGTTYALTFMPFVTLAVVTDVISPVAAFASFGLIQLPHVWFDTRKPLNWYWVHVKRLSLDPASHPLFAILRLEMDQAFHISCLAAATGILVSI